VCLLRFVSAFESLQGLPDLNQTCYERNDNGIATKGKKKISFMKLVNKNEGRILTATSFRVLI